MSRQIETRSASPLRLGSGQQHGVDDVDNAIGLIDIGDGHSGRTTSTVSDLDLIAVEAEGQLATLNGSGLELTAIVLDQLDQIGRVNATGNRVIGEDAGELILVFWHQQGFDSAGRESVKSGVDRSEDRERAFALQRFGKTGSLDRGNERGVVSRVD